MLKHTGLQRRSLTRWRGFEHRARLQEARRPFPPLIGRPLSLAARCRRLPGGGGHGCDGRPRPLCARRGLGGGAADIQRGHWQPKSTRAHRDFRQASRSAFLPRHSDGGIVLSGTVCRMMEGNMMTSWCAFTHTASPVLHRLSEPTSRRTQRRQHIVASAVVARQIKRRPALCVRLGRRGCGARRSPFHTLLAGERRENGNRAQR